MKKIILFSLMILAALSELFAQASRPPEEKITYNNPVIPGFFSDPSVCRVGEEFRIPERLGTLNRPLRKEFEKL